MRAGGGVTAADIRERCIKDTIASRDFKIALKAAQKQVAIDAKNGIYDANTIHDELLLNSQIGKVTAKLYSDVQAAIAQATTQPVVLSPEDEKEIVAKVTNLREQAPVALVARLINGGDTVKALKDLTHYASQEGDLTPKEITYLKKIFIKKLTDLHKPQSDTDKVEKIGGGVSQKAVKAYVDPDILDTVNRLIKATVSLEPRDRNITALLDYIDRLPEKYLSVVLNGLVTTFAENKSLVEPFIKSLQQRQEPTLKTLLRLLQLYAIHNPGLLPIKVNVLSPQQPAEVLRLKPIPQLEKLDVVEEGSEEEEEEEQQPVIQQPVLPVPPVTPPAPKPAAAVAATPAPVPQPAAQRVAPRVPPQPRRVEEEKPPRVALPKGAQEAIENIKKLDIPSAQGGITVSDFNDSIAKLFPSLDQQQKAHFAQEIERASNGKRWLCTYCGNTNGSLNDPEQCDLCYRLKKGVDETPLEKQASQLFTEWVCTQCHKKTPVGANICLNCHTPRPIGNPSPFFNRTGNACGPIANLQLILSALDPENATALSISKDRIERKIGQLFFEQDPAMRSALATIILRWSVKAPREKTLDGLTGFIKQHPQLQKYVTTIDLNIDPDLTDWSNPPVVEPNNPLLTGIRTGGGHFEAVIKKIINGKTTWYWIDQQVEKDKPATDYCKEIATPATTPTGLTHTQREFGVPIDIAILKKQPAAEEKKGVKREEKKEVKKEEPSESSGEEESEEEKGEEPSGGEEEEPVAPAPTPSQQTSRLASSLAPSPEEAKPVRVEETKQAAEADQEIAKQLYKIIVDDNVAAFTKAIAGLTKEEVTRRLLLRYATGGSKTPHCLYEYAGLKSLQLLPTLVPDLTDQQNTFMIAWAAVRKTDNERAINSILLTLDPPKRSSIAGNAIEYLRGKNMEGPASLVAACLKQLEGPTQTAAPASAPASSLSSSLAPSPAESDAPDWQEFATAAQEDAQKKEKEKNEKVTAFGKKIKRFEEGRDDAPTFEDLWQTIASEQDTATRGILESLLSQTKLPEAQLYQKKEAAAPPPAPGPVAPPTPPAVAASPVAPAAKSPPVLQPAVLQQQNQDLVIARKLREWALKPFNPIDPSEFWNAIKSDLELSHKVTISDDTIAHRLSLRLSYDTTTLVQDEYNGYSVRALIAFQGRLDVLRSLMPWSWMPKNKNEYLEEVRHVLYNAVLADQADNTNQIFVVNYLLEVLGNGVLDGATKVCNLFVAAGKQSKASFLWGLTQAFIRPAPAPEMQAPQLAVQAAQPARKSLFAELQPLKKWMDSIFSLVQRAPFPETFAFGLTLDDFTKALGSQEKVPQGATEGFNPPSIPGVLDVLSNYNGKKYYGVDALKIAVQPNACICCMGDIHGSFGALYRNLIKLRDIGFLDPSFKIKKQNDLMVFTGDYMSRGKNKIAVVYTLLLLAATNPGQVFLLRGNHEIPWLSERHSYGNKTEIESLYGAKNGELVWQRLIDHFFEKLPYVLFLGIDHFGWLQCCHGGVDPVWQQQKFLGQTVTAEGQPWREDADFAQNLFQTLNYTQANPAIANIDDLGAAWNQCKADLAHTVLSKPSDNGYPWAEFDDGQGFSRPAKYNAGIRTGAAIAQQVANALGIRGWIRGHQHEKFGLKIGGETHWRMSNIQPMYYSKILREGYPYAAQFRFSDARVNEAPCPVFTLSTASEAPDLWSDADPSLIPEPYDSFIILDTHIFDTQVGRTTVKDFMVHVYEKAVTSAPFWEPYAAIKRQKIAKQAEAARPLPPAPQQQQPASAKASTVAKAMADRMADRPAGRQAPQVLQPQQATVKCNVCSYLNAPDRETCDHCGNPLPATDEPSEQPSPEELAQISRDSYLSELIEAEKKYRQTPGVVEELRKILGCGSQNPFAYVKKNQATIGLDKLERACGYLREIENRQLIHAHNLRTLQAKLQEYPDEQYLGSMQQDIVDLLQALKPALKPEEREGYIQEFVDASQKRARTFGDETILTVEEIRKRIQQKK